MKPKICNNFKLNIIILIIITILVLFFSLKDNFNEACKNQQFRRLLKTIDVTDDIAMKYTSSLEETVEELNHCSKCPGLIECQNRFDGHVLYPEKKGKQIVFSYTPCKYEKERIEKESNRMRKCESDRHGRQRYDAP